MNTGDPLPTFQLRLKGPTHGTCTRQNYQVVVSHCSMPPCIMWFGWMQLNNVSLNEHDEFSDHGPGACGSYSGSLLLWSSDVHIYGPSMLLVLLITFPSLLFVVEFLLKKVSGQLLQLSVHEKISEQFLKLKGNERKKKERSGE